MYCLLRPPLLPWCSCLSSCGVSAAAGTAARKLSSAEAAAVAVVGIASGSPPCNAAAASILCRSCSQSPSVNKSDWSGPFLGLDALCLLCWGCWCSRVAAWFSQTSSSAAVACRLISLHGSKKKQRQQRQGGQVMWHIGLHKLQMQSLAWTPGISVADVTWYRQ